MPVNLKNRNFLSLKDFTQEEIIYLLDLAHALKKAKRTGTEEKRLLGKNIALIFEKTSTRTRCAFEVAAYDQGANVTYLDSSGSQMGKKESVEDTAKVLGRFFDGIEFRGFKQESVEILAEYSGAVVWNGLTDRYHPTQILADIMTVEEKVDKPLQEVVFTYVGDGRNNMANSLMIGCAKLGMEIRIVSPKELFPSDEIVQMAKGFAAESGGKVVITEEIASGVKGSDVLYTDVWVSMGEEHLFEERIRLLKDYQVNMDMVQKTENPNMIFLHCLPAFHDTNTVIGKDIFEKYGLKEMEVTDEVFRSKHSVVFDEAENRLHTIKAVMVATLGN